MSNFKAQLFQLFELSEDQADFIVSKFTRESFNKQELFLETEKQCDRLSFIESGYFRVFKWTEQKEVTQ